jgi:hypothetical protein
MSLSLIPAPSLSFSFSIYLSLSPLSPSLSLLLINFLFCLLPIYPKIDKHTSLPRKFANYGRKKFHNVGSSTRSRTYSAASAPSPFFLPSTTGRRHASSGSGNGITRVSGSAFGVTPRSSWPESTRKASQR